MRLAVSACFLIALVFPTLAAGQVVSADEQERLDRIEAALQEAEEAMKTTGEYVIVESPFSELETACVEFKIADACFLAGEAWFDGHEDVTPDIVQAVNLWRAGCAFGSADSCYRSGSLIAQGRAEAKFRSDGALIVNLKGADDLLALACEGGVLPACRLRGDINLSPGAVLAEGATWDFEGDLIGGRQAFELGCRAEGSAATEDLPRDEVCCTRLATMYERGRGGVRRDRALAQLYWDLACDAAGPEDTGSCAEAERLRGAEVTPSGDSTGRVSVQPRRDRPDTARFSDPRAGALGETSESHFRRWEFEIGVGARVRYTADQSMALFKLRAGTTVWFNVVGITAETAFSTDRFAGVQRRLYTRFQHALGLKFGVPIQFKNPWGATMFFGWGVGGTVGSVKFHPAGYVFAYGARQHVQLALGTSQSSGPRQWGALRIEQQQTWHVAGGPAPDHSTQFVLLTGFTFGGKGPDWRPGVHEQKKP